jgi:hypothetical protein
LKGGALAKMTKPIGRVWINDDCISGYIVYGPMQTDIIKFAFEKKYKQAWIYPSKKKEEISAEAEMPQAD